MNHWPVLRSPWYPRGQHTRRERVATTQQEGVMSGQMDRQAIHAEMELARGTFQTLVATASPDME
jgi:hypothetical protein